MQTRATGDFIIYRTDNLNVVKSKNILIIKMLKQLVIEHYLLPPKSENISFPPKELMFSLCRLLCF